MSACRRRAAKIISVVHDKIKCFAPSTSLILWIIVASCGSALRSFNAFVSVGVSPDALGASGLLLGMMLNFWLEHGTKARCLVAEVMMGARRESIHDLNLEGLSLYTLGSLYAHGRPRRRHLEEREGRLPSKWHQIEEAGLPDLDFGREDGDAVRPTPRAFEAFVATCS